MNAATRSRVDNYWDRSKQLRSVGTREALTTPFLLRREWGR